MMVFLMKKFKNIFATLNIIVFLLLCLYVETGSTEEFLEGIIFILLIGLVSFPTAWMVNSSKDFEEKFGIKHIYAILYIILIVGILFWIQTKKYGL